MASTPRDNLAQDAEPWREKYYQSLDALEQQEQAWRQIETVLRQALLRLCAVSSVSDPRLDALRAELRSGTGFEGLTPLFEEITRELAATTAAGNSPATALARELLSALSEPLLAEAGSDEAGLVRATLKDGEQGLRRAAEQLVKLLGERLANAGPAVNAALLRLLELIAIPSEFAPRADALRSELLEPLTAERLEPVLRGMAELIADMRTGVLREKRALEDFLSQLTEGLQTLDDNLHAAAKTQIDSFDEGRRLGSAMDAHMQGIESAMLSADALEKLKATLSVRVQAIRGQMEAFRRIEEARAAEVEREMAVLAERLSALEIEAEGLRERVRAEHRQALLDPLTGLANRLAYDERMEHEFQRWRRYGAPLVLSVWDVDHFKRVNDSYGHQAGDKVLRVIATLLKGQTRAADFVCRYGGEEFIILLPETSLANAWTCLEKIRLAVASAEFRHRSERVKVTVSCGMAQFRDGDTVEDVFNRADRALYAAKRAGRNCCRTDEDPG